MQTYKSNITRSGTSSISTEARIYLLGFQFFQQYTVCMSIYVEEKEEGIGVRYAHRPPLLLLSFTNIQVIASVYLKRAREMVW